ncbi:Nucleoporin [Wickerhamomyces ciferrii]|uniref:Nucleoporin n=1 Tax=Wickerhamomyces ciferrii (strain ATCC 14091 / BCRC 22168 / CBS 111 / JCM 3599 / NBRC 0793 / NRRL Y-1031 F-60-10) TaxID=1206466 RepID=K0KV04_WICCF|nr:Nucleoporin [Wickerhamomyces ciferrii]CCH45254.1 Nucleoporin [Wickerhamomyces ciferrii]
MAKHWSVSSFVTLYRSIEQGGVDLNLLKELKQDLNDLTIIPKKNQTSRQTLEKGKITIEGVEYEVNDEFKIAAATVADELNIDELIAAELIQTSTELGADLIDNAKASYYLRKQHILSVVSYIFNAGDKTLSDLLFSESFVTSLLNSFKEIHEELDSISQSVQRARILGQYNSNDLQQRVAFRRNFLNKEHEALGEILYGLASHGLLSKANFIKFYDFVATFDVDDLFILHLVPALLFYVSKLNNLKEEEVKELHSHLLKDLHNKDQIYKVPAKLLIILVFLTYFIDWCKQNSKRVEQFDFEIAIESPMTIAAHIGAIEQLLIITAETTDNAFELFYDLRALLEQYLPRLVPKRVLDINEEETKKLRSSNLDSTSTVYVITKNVKVSDNIKTLLTSVLHDFVQSFISDAAFLLIKIKDAEEDSLLSGEDSLLDDISKKADLERFYLSVFYLYSNREDLISTFWEDRESNAYGFIEWASKVDDLLMKSTFCVMISALASGSSNANHVYHFIASSEKTPWSLIFTQLNAYIEKIIKFEQNGDDNDLSEEIILSTSSFFTLIYQVASNNDVVKELFDESVLNCIFNFIRLDTPLVGAALKLLSSLVSSNKARKSFIWERLDLWLFSQASTPLRDSFRNLLITFPDVVGFIDLLEALLKPSNKFGTYELPFPVNLGSSYRKQGIAPYIEFLLTDVFYHSPALFFSEKMSLQVPILKMIEYCLNSFDPSLILNSFPAGADLNAVVETADFPTFVQANPAPIALNFLFQEKVHKVLFEIASTGIDQLSDKLENEEQVKLVDQALIILEKVLDLEVTYTDELLPLILKSTTYYIPGNFGTHGIRSFYDAILFNLPLIAHISLYVGSTHLSIADKSIRLLSRFSKSSQFGSSNTSGSLIGKNRLLTVLESIDESTRIKHAFIDQLEAEITDEIDLKLKIQILNFINSNLSLSSKSYTISHFLLGFDLKNSITLGDSETDTLIASKTSVLKTLLYILESSLLTVSNYNIDYAPIRLAASVLEILLKLCRNSATSSLILEYISNYDLLTKLLNTPKVDLNTLWSNTRFDGSDTQNNFSSGPGIGALLSFLNQRSLVLQYLSLELHRTSVEGSISKTSSYITKLISGEAGYVGPPKVLAFLDILEFNLSEVSNLPEELLFFKDVDLNINLNKIPLSLNSNDSIFDLKDIDSLLDLSLVQSWTQGTYHTDDDEESKYNAVNELKLELKRADSRSSQSLVKIPKTIKSDQADAESERKLIKGRFTNYLAHLKFKAYQLSALHSWVQLIQVAVTDGKLDPVQRSNFILEVFQTVIPKINDYVESDVLYAEELVFLCVSLYDLYHKDRQIIGKDDSNVLDGYERLYPLFRACINGILSPMSTLSLRSDLYVLANKYLTWVLEQQVVAKEILKSIKLSSERLITVICNDAIGGEGATRITGLLLLESLFQLSNINQLNFVLNTLVKNNLLLLLVKSIKRTDETLTLSHENKITLDSLLYELTAFKATLSFLIRVAETRHGAQQLLQGEIFQTIKSCSFLLIDPDLGLELVFDEATVQTSTFVRVNLNLDTPLTFNDSSNGVSLFELLVPTFQLVAAILLSTSSENKPVIQQVHKLLLHFRRLIVGVLKRDVLAESKSDHEVYKTSGETSGLKELVNLFVLLSTLTGFDGEDAAF